MSTGLIAKSITGVKWNAVSTAIMVLSQVGLMAAMARLLDPAAFGLMAMALVGIRFGGHFARLGVGPALIQKKTVTVEDVRASFTLSVLLGATLFAITWALAPLVVMFFDNPELLGLMRALAISLFLNALSVVSIALLRRDLRFKNIALVDVGSYLIGYGVVGLAAAYFGFGVWSLVFATLAQSTLTLFLAFAFIRHSIVPTFDRARFSQIWKFGSRYSVVGMLEFVGANLDTAVVGRAFGAASLGFYNRAFLLTNLPVEHTVNMGTKVLFPALSARQNDVDQVGRVYLFLLWFVATFSGAVCAGMIPAAHDLVLFLLGPQWVESAPIVQVLALSVPFVFMSHVSGVVLDARAALAARLRIQATAVAVLVVAMLALSDSGVLGIAAAVVVAEIVRLVLYVAVLRRKCDLSTVTLIRVFLFALSVSGVTALSVWLVANGMAPTLPAIVRVAIEVLVGVASLLIVTATLWVLASPTGTFQPLADRTPVLGVFTRWARPAAR